MEAGNRCFDMRVPEEINRKMVDHIADINLTYSSIAREYLLNRAFQQIELSRLEALYFLDHYRRKLLIQTF